MWETLNTITIIMVPVTCKVTVYFKGNVNVKVTVTFHMALFMFTTTVKVYISLTRA